MKRSALTVKMAAVITALLASGCVAMATPTAEPSPVETTVIPTTMVTEAPTVEPTATPALTPRATPTPTPTVNPEEYAAEFVETVLEYVNEAREENGLKPLELSPALCAGAAVRADEYRQKVEAVNQPGYLSVGLSNDIAHTRINGDSFGTIFDEIGITRWSYADENLVFGRLSGITAHKDGVIAFESWKGSPSHWEAILYADWTKTGIGVVINEYGWFACQLFTTGHKEPEVIPSLVPQTLPPDWTPQPEDTP